MTPEQKKHLIAQMRYCLVAISKENKIPHLASALSCLDILYVLYFEVMKFKLTQPDWLQRDYFLLGKGHAVAALYTVLGFRGFYEKDRVFELGQNGSPFEEHPGVNSPPGVDNISGSLGHALGLATGKALAAKMSGIPSHFYTLLGDGELGEGTVWEAAMFAAAHDLDNVTVIIDFNKLQGTGRSCDILHLETLEHKWEAFGWQTFRVDGHDIAALKKVLQEDALTPGKPRAIIADTIKGAGISFMEDDNNWHYKIPTHEELETVANELSLEYKDNG